MLSKARTLGRRASIPLVILLMAAVAACGGASMGGPAATGAPAAPGDALGPDGKPVDGQGGETDGQNGGRPPAYAPTQPDLLIIKNGTLVLQVTGIDAALAAATQQITALGGYASGSERFGEKESDQATITFRIPAARWDDALAGLRSLATKILGERTSTEDVTAQVVDLGARIKNLQATELALQGIMTRATEIKDVLSVQAELTTVRGQIEQLTAQKTNLEGLAAFSTLSVTFSLKPDPVLAETEQFDPESVVDQASASLVSILQGLATAGIWFAIVWLPILLVLAIVVGVGLFIARRIRRPSDLPAAPAAPSGESSS